MHFTFLSCSYESAYVWSHAENKMIAALTACEPAAFTVGNTASDPFLSQTEFRVMSVLSDLYDKEIISIIGWAKQVPGMGFLFIVT